MSGDRHVHGARDVARQHHDIHGHGRRAREHLLLSRPRGQRLRVFRVFEHGTEDGPVIDTNVIDTNRRDVVDGLCLRLEVRRRRHLHPDNLVPMTLLS